MLRDAMYRQRLLNGEGARVVIIPAAGNAPEAASGRWHVEGERCFALLESPCTLPEGIANLRVDLGAGIFRFTAWLRPCGGQRCEVWMHRIIDVEENRRATRVAVILPAMIGQTDDSLNIPVTVRNISARGLAFETTSEPAQGASYRLRFEGAPGEGFGVLTVQVVRKDRRDEIWYCGCVLHTTPLLQERLYALIHELRTHAATV